MSARQLAATVVVLMLWRVNTIRVMLGGAGSRGTGSSRFR